MSATAARPTMVEPLNPDGICMIGDIPARSMWASRLSDVNGIYRPKTTRRLALSPPARFEPTRDLDHAGHVLDDAVMAQLYDAEEMLNQWIIPTPVAKRERFDYDDGVYAGPYDIYPTVAAKAMSLSCGGCAQGRRRHPGAAASLILPASPQPI